MKRKGVLRGEIRSRWPVRGTKANAARNREIQRAIAYVGVS